jgi:iron complex outermembrane receptor protein
LLAKSNVTVAADLATYTPSLSANQRYGPEKSNSTRRRCFHRTAERPGAEGQQGTLFGRNTTGGAVLLTPAKPTGNLEGVIEGTYVQYDQMKVTGVLNFPLADAFMIAPSSQELGPPAIPGRFKT